MDVVVVVGAFILSLILGEIYIIRSNIDYAIWEGALKSAEKMIQKYGEENLGPYSDFEWGMLNGKLSALRWVLGEDWDMLDT